ncbi:formamidopyrimidine-DNA glycosylase isoform X2 [Ziziphus jujuba]|uniref:Formamidopyrimidine-DNA glycosylase isoform X2 n=1 Tax=Ziziphus jujuba TaxID=326968 RepID=A0A6P3Z677_ZIZJJ|nr:formamidopyrimidine-DNA glycosylase isoform X2 [Ziziphus jujuba]
MPELPEVEVARRAIEDHCIGKTIKRSIVANDSKVIEGVSASDFEAALVGKTIVAAYRKGKNLWLQLDSPPFPSFQFGMAGAIYIKGVAVTTYKRSAVKDTDEWPSKYSKVFIQLDDGLEFSFTDKRRFAKVRLLEDPTSAPPISELGPDALLELKSVDEFVESLSKKKTAIKALLLDQSYISGIGNWVADEVLYQAKIHPLQIASSLSRESCATLHKCIKEVIEKAIELGADSSQYPSNWIFHSREKKPGKAFVDGLAPDLAYFSPIELFIDCSPRKKIEFITAGGRTTAFVPDLQKLSRNQAANAVSKPQKQSGRKKGHKDDSDNDDVDEPASDEDKIAESVKPKKGAKSRGQGRTFPAKRKSKESDDDDDNTEDNDGEDDEDQKKVTNNKQLKAEKTNKKKVPTGKNGKNAKKKAK